MEHEFWHQRWKNGETAFHTAKPNPLLIKHFASLELGKSSRIFLPLCGKTRDIAWLLDQGYAVSGIELSELAINQLFNDLDIKPEISISDTLKHYHAKNLDIFVGDFFSLTEKQLGHIDAIYDRAALVALPENMRPEYTARLVSLTKAAPQLLITYEYDQSLINGPPFSISEHEVRNSYTASYQVNLLERQPVEGGLKSIASSEAIWRLHALK